MNTTFVIFSGMAGTGKTTLARLLCQRRHIPLISFDHFVDYSWPRRLLDVEVLTDEEFWNILFSTVDLQLSLGLSVVMDAVFAGIGRDIAQQMAVRRKARFCAIHTFCSNETLWQERVITRERTALSNETPAKWEGIMAERDNFRAWNPDQALFIDAIHSVETNLAHILAYLDSAQ